MSSTVRHFFNFLHHFQIAMNTSQSFFQSFSQGACRQCSRSALSPLRLFVSLLVVLIVLVVLAGTLGSVSDMHAQTPSQTRQQLDSAFIITNYTKYEYQIPMRDGVKLFTNVYVPKDAAASQKYPMMLERTCYDVSPYGADKYQATAFRGNHYMLEDKYIFVNQDVRGRWMSEGTWTNMTPHLSGDNSNGKTKSGKSKNDDKPVVDEATDTYDTIEWLLKNVKFHNGRVGQWGTSYPGFYTIAGALCDHPALKASSPQAPVSDFFFEDFHHNGAFTQGYLLAYPVFGVQKQQPISEAWYASARPKTFDGWQFNLDIGSMRNVADKLYGYSDNFFWKETIDHPNYDAFWQKRSIVPHLKGVKHAIMTVGGWFDAEDLVGPLTIYKTLEKNNPRTYNTLVMGPFGHGDWSKRAPQTLHSNIYFGDSLSHGFLRDVEAKFFRHFLKEDADGSVGGKQLLPEAYLFDTGSKVWRSFDEWPLKTAKKKMLHFTEVGGLSNAPDSAAQKGYSEYVSDPAKPVPYTEDRATLYGFTPRNYMSEDQRFASQRTDVLTFQTDTLTEDITLGGEMLAKLAVSTTGSDADWVVKLIDVLPGWTPNHAYMPHKNIVLGGYQMMVRSEIMRSRFRKSFEKPSPMSPNEITDITFRLQDVLHTFKKGHRIMVQLQSSMFPAFDRNPQKYVENIYKAQDRDFIKATHRVYHSKEHQSGLSVEVIETTD
jgi:uncharacterized protein